jgi:uncharacterized delta-60 repeat protein
MALSKTARISISKKIVDYRSRRRGLEDGIAAIQAALLEAQSLDAANKAAFDVVNARISAYHYEYRSMYGFAGNDRSDVTDFDLETAVDLDPNSRFYPTNAMALPPSLSAPWLVLQPYMRTIGFGLNANEVADTNSALLESDLITALRNSLDEVNTSGIPEIEFVTGLECSGDIFTPSAAVSATIAQAVADAEAWLERLTLYRDQLPANEIDGVRKSGNSVYAGVLDAAIAAVETWLGLPDTNPSHGQLTCVAFYALDPSTLGPTKMQTSVANALIAVLDNRVTEQQARAAQIQTYFGVPSQDLVTGEVTETGYNGFPFDVNTGTASASADIRGAAVLSDGSVVLSFAGTNVFNGTPAPRLVKLRESGKIDDRFLTNIGTAAQTQTIAAVVADASDNLFLGGTFTTFNSKSRRGLVKLFSNGTEDQLFNEAFMGPLFIGPNASVLAVAVQPDGKVLVGGQFTSYNGNARNHLIRLNADGSEDVAFYANLGTAFDSVVSSIAIQADGKIVVGGSFTTLNSVSRGSLVRLNANGSEDAGFAAAIGTGVAGTVSSVAIQADGKIVIGGGFNTVNGNVRLRAARLNADGSDDAGFYANFGGVGGGLTVVNVVKVRPDQKILIGGNYSAVTPSPRTDLNLLNTNGSLDATFTTNVGTATNPGQVLGIAVYADNRAVVVGQYALFNGATRNGVVRLAPDGTLDPTIIPEDGVGIYVERWPYLKLLISRIGGSSFNVRTHENILARQQQAILDAEFAFNAYRLLCNAVLLSAPTNATKAVHVKDSSGFQVGDNVFVVSDTQEEVSATIVAINGNSFDLSQPVAAKYRPNEWARLYKDLT